ncbi:MAG: ATP-dependent DNA helicase RecG [Lachnospiraceae bacterium]|nr:ATP-dependent DNA helicase RecG [Lachnospiraceae bacterium]
MKIIDIKGIGEKTEKLFHKLRIEDSDDLLAYYPRNYDIYEQPIYIKDIDNRAVVTISGVIVKTPEINKVKNLQIVSSYIKDGVDDLLKVTWFNMPFLRNTLKAGTKVILRGRLSRKGGILTLEQPQIFSSADYVKKMDELQPVYGLTAGLTNTVVRKAVKTVLDLGKYDGEYLPESIINKYGLCGYEEAIRGIHFPKNKDEVIKSRNRLVFDEFFLFINTLRNLKDKTEVAVNIHLVNDFDKEEAFIKELPYELTGAQKKVWEEIKADLSGETVMNRLIQGDVGSGKTILAMLALMAVANNGEQGALMVPTEVLAKQHYNSIMEMNEKYNLNIHPVLLDGSMTVKEKRRIYDAIECGYANVIIGTHALIQDRVIYNNLALVITDEQHRFGVRQREKLAEKGDNVHIMVMSATPIPRTLAIILYGELDISVVDELPANRLPIKNCVVGKSYRPNAYKFMQQQINQGHQVYVICPMVEENDNLEAENVVDYAKNLSRELAPDVKVEYLHGKMKGSAKNDIMERFAANEIQVLVSTTVIEVGVNVPNATVMMVENAERFGLAALHQLRGRVGRGDAQSYCIFLSTSDKPEAFDRLNILNKSNDGFFIASEDLKLRGAGDFFGIRQSGDMGFILGDIYQDANVIKNASEAVNLIDLGEVIVTDEEQLNMDVRIAKYTRFAMDNINL